MARLPRLSVAQVLHHVLLRGNNRQPVFADDADRVQWLRWLDEAARGARLALHAYVLMDNHVHLLLTPVSADGLAQAMQGLGRRYARYFNDRHGRSGALWEGRYRSVLLEADRWLAPAMTYLDLNPVRAARVAQPGDWPWSSHAWYAGGTPPRALPQLTAPAAYWALGNTPFAREAAYAARVQAGLGASQLAALRHAVHAGWALGGPAFLADLQQRTARRVSPGQRGRPRKGPPPQAGAAPSAEP